MKKAPTTPWAPALWGPNVVDLMPEQCKKLGIRSGPLSARQDGVKSWMRPVGSPRPSAWIPADR